MSLIHTARCSSLATIALGERPWYAAVVWTMALCGLPTSRPIARLTFFSRVSVYGIAANAVRRCLVDCVFEESFC